MAGERARAEAKLFQQANEFVARGSGLAPKQRVELDDELSRADRESAEGAAKGGDFVAFDVDEDPVGPKPVAGTEAVDGGERNDKRAVRFAAVAVGRAEAAEAFDSGAVEGGVSGVVADALRDHRDALAFGIAREVALEDGAGGGVGLEGEDMTVWRRPAREQQRVDADVSTDVEADIAGFDVGAKEVAERRLVGFGEESAMVRVDGEGFASVEGAVKPAAMVEEMFVGGTAEANDGAVASDALGDAGAELLEHRMMVTRRSDGNR